MKDEERKSESVNQEWVVWATIATDEPDEERLKMFVDGINGSCYYNIPVIKYEIDGKETRISYLKTYYRFSCGVDFRQENDFYLALPGGILLHSNPEKDDHVRFGLRVNVMGPNKSYYFES